ncbi:MAG: hypothetical protein WC080_00275 [Patescibacteria group bacterium]
MLKANLFFVYSITVVAIASFILCVFNYNPFDASVANFVYFYLSLFLGLAGMFSIILFYLKIYLKKSEIIFSLFWPSVRQAVLFSSAITSLFILRGVKILDFWIGIPIVLVIGLLELFFQTKKVKIV